MTKIEWAHAGLGRGETWNPIRARDRRRGKGGWHCEKVSPACANCYAERQNLAGARGGTKLAYKPGHRGDVEIFLDEKTLLAPLRWKQPRGIFACSMTDIFGDWVSDEWLDKIFAAAALCPQHILIFLTKRAARMRAYLSDPETPKRIALSIIKSAPRSARAIPTLFGGALNAPADRAYPWPLPNIWLGVTAEDQQRANERHWDLRALADMGWTTIVSYEPALGPVDWTGWEFVRQIIFGGETGPHARPPHPDWARNTRDFCSPRGIAFFFKRWGEFYPADQISSYEQLAAKGDIGRALRDGHASDLGDQWTWRLGMRISGRLLDGREHNEFPEARR